MSVAVTKYVDTFVQECERLGVVGESDGRYRLVGCAIECYYAIGGAWRESLREAVGASRCIEVGSGAREVGASGGSEICGVAGGRRAADDGDVRGAGQGEKGVAFAEAFVGDGLSADELRGGSYSAVVGESGAYGGDAGSSVASDGAREVDGAALHDERLGLPAVAAGGAARGVGALRVVDDVARSVAGADSRSRGGRSVMDRGRSDDESEVGFGSVRHLGGTFGQVGADRGGEEIVDVKAVRGKQYANNKRKREKRKIMQGAWRRTGGGACESGESTAGTVRTVDTRTAVEVEAAQTLAARRVAENKVAAKLAEHRLRALNDTARTDAVDRLAAARAEKAINQAKAASQKSFKECDQSLKSLGSTGSAGEFALKQAVKEARDNEKVHKYVKQQLDLTMRYVSDDVKRMVAELPAPEFEDEMEVFGDCPSEYSEEQRESYYMNINARSSNRGTVARPASPLSGTGLRDYPVFDVPALFEKYHSGVKLTSEELVALEMGAAQGLV